MIDDMHAEVYAREWRSGVLVNPFRMIEDAVDAPHEWDRWFTVSPEVRLERIASTSEEVALLFLDCTDYLAEGSLLQDLREGEKGLLTAVVTYVYAEALPRECNLCMVAELVETERKPSSRKRRGGGIGSKACALRNAKPCDSKGDEPRTVLDHLFDEFAANDPAHPVLFFYEKYTRCAAGRKRVCDSISLRLRPLYSLFADEKNILTRCSSNEALRLAVALLHNSTQQPEGPLSLLASKKEIAFVAAALGYMMLNRKCKGYLTRRHLGHILANPALLYSALVSEMAVASDDRQGELSKVIGHWDACGKEILSGGCDWERFTCF
jgi:hypothetical protein